MTPKIYGNSYEIVQSPDAVVIRYEMIHEARIIPLDGRPHVASSSSSTWATHAADGRATRWSWKRPTFIPPSTTGARPRACELIERFTPVSPNQVEWSVTYDDREDVDAALDVGDAADEGREPGDLRVWVP